MPDLEAVGGGRDHAPGHATELNRVLVVGCTGSGKTTLAASIARTLGIPHIELDSLFWEPGWVQAERDAFQERVAAATAGERWVADGNYLGHLGDLLWSRADAVVWPDIALTPIILRLIRRTTLRALSREELWAAGNREKLWNLVNKKESLIVWALKTHRSHRERYAQRIVDPAWAHIAFVRLRSRGVVRDWVGSLAGDGQERSDLPDV